MAGWRFGRRGISRKEKPDKIKKTEEKAAGEGRITEPDAVTMEIPVYQNRKKQDEESRRLQDEAAKKIGFILLEEVMLVHTDEMIS